MEVNILIKTSTIFTAWYTEHTWYWYEYVFIAIYAWVVMYAVQFYTMKYHKK